MEKESQTLIESPPMQTKAIKAIIFDLGGVVFEWNPRNLYRRYFGGPEEMEAFLIEINFAAWNAQQDKGRPWAQAAAELSAQFPHRADLIRAYWEYWEESIGGPISGTDDIIRRLKSAGWPLYALTNWSGETFPIARRKYDFLRVFDDIIVSGEVGWIKPDRAIFQLVTEKAGVSAAQCLLIDDHAENIATAQKLGMQAIQFYSAARLQARLVELRVLQA